MTFDEIMAFNAPYNKLNFDKLVEQIKENNIAPYIGSGMSVLFDDVYPVWSQFLLTTFKFFCCDCEQKKFDELNFEDKADYLYNEIGKLTFNDHLKKVFGEEHLNCLITEFYDKPVYLLPIIFQRNLLVTTNYDKVIEKIYQLHNKILTVAHPGHNEALNNALRIGELLLYKIHGDISEPQTSIILTKEQYNLFYQNTNLTDKLKQIFTGKQMLFLGCSLEKDRPIELLCNVSQAGMKNYAIISCNSECVKDRRKQLEREYYTQAIIYPLGEHECMRIILEQIAERIDPEMLKLIKIRDNTSGTIISSSSKLNLSNEWFINQNRIQIKNLGNRYLPELNIKLDIHNVFNSLARNESFLRRFINKSDNLLILLKELKLAAIIDSLNEFQKIIETFSIETTNLLDIDNLCSKINILYEILDKEKNYYKQLMSEPNGARCNKDYRDEIYKLNKAINEIDEYSFYLNSTEIKAVNIPFVLIDGDGGAGKSHLIADIIKNRSVNGNKSVLFLGQHFKEEKNPFNEMMDMLDLNCNMDVFLAELNLLGNRNKSRVVIFIDALNEGNGKKIWKDYLGGIIEKLKLYPWVGLVMSIRTEYIHLLINDNDSLVKDLVRVTHKGFATIEYKAIKKYFDFYKIAYSDIPFSNQEFRNPLFLRLFCEGFKNSSINLDTISFMEVYKNYLKAINLRIAEVCQYSNHNNIVEKVINEIVQFKYESGFGNNLTSLEKVIEIIAKIETKYNIHKSLLDELLSEGVITQNLNYKNENYIYVTYEKLEDYLYAKLLANELNSMKVDLFAENHKNLLDYEDILEALTIVLAEDENYELFEIYNDEKNNENIIRAFIAGLKWRSSDSITSKTLEYINTIVLKSGYHIENIFDVLILISTKIGHQLNAEHTVDNILQIPMSDRDAFFIPLLEELLYEEGSSVNRLLDWALSNSEYGNVLNETIRLTAIMISTFLISSNRYLRDKSTKALVSLLNGHIDILLSVLKKFENVDDAYILERLYAVAFGCVVSETSEIEIEKLAKYVYTKIFESGCVYPNILLRDYAKSIVDYAKYKIEKLDIDISKTIPPYKSTLPEVPTDEEIAKYEYDYKSADFKDHFWSRNAILSSMRVEYSRDGSSGGYGDFGRYVFQSYFRDWKQLDPNDLKNIAIKKIFNMGYDIEKHGVYDRSVHRNRSGQQKRERIGKKYQWIALYELAAQISDNYKLLVYVDDQGSKEYIYCKGSFEPNIRNIDPTIKNISIVDEDVVDKPIHKQLYQIPKVTNTEWLLSFNDISSMDSMINLQYDKRDFILLNGWYSWTEEKKLGVKKYQNPHKDIWIQINSYIVKREQIDKFMKVLTDKDFMGRWMPEPNENYILYNKEYYWSEGYLFFRNPYYCGEEWVNINEYGDSFSELGKILIPTFQYQTERQGDLLGEDNHYSWYKPCNELFNGLNMKYGKENSVLRNHDGNVICFDSNELLKENIGFFIEKNAFMHYLKTNGYTVFWTILGEKRIMGESNNSEKVYEQPHFAGIYTVDNNGQLVGTKKEFKD